MPELSSGASMTTAVTDLIIGVMIIPIIFILKSVSSNDKTLKRLWLGFFIYLGIGSIFGFFAHCYMWDPKQYSTIWVFLYAVLYMILKSFLDLSVYYCTNCGFYEKHRKIILYITAAAYIATALMEMTGINPIRVFVVFGIIYAIPALFLFSKKAFREKDRDLQLIFTAFIPQIFGVVYQLMRKGAFWLIWVFDYNSIYHFCLMISTVIFFFSSKRMIKNS